MKNYYSKTYTLIRAIIKNTDKINLFQTIGEPPLPICTRWRILVIRNRVLCGEFYRSKINSRSILICKSFI